ncbi:hypothetical protein [Desulfoplanes sp.]
MELIIIVTFIAALLSVWGLGYTFLSVRNNIARHEAWQIKKRQEMERKLQALKDKQSFYLANMEKSALI